MRRFWKWAAGISLVCCAALFFRIWHTTENFPDSVMLRDVDAVENNTVNLRMDAVSSAKQTAYDGKWTLWGIVPVKSVQVTTNGKPMVRVCGTPFGIKLYTDGVLVVGLGAVDSTVGSVNPAAQAGLKVGDRLLSIGGTAVTDNEQVSRLIAASGGKTLTLSVERNGIRFDAALTPVMSKSDGIYRAGLWVRDSAAGVGMLTFYDPLNGVCVGLGHPITDRDTGLRLTVAGGELVNADIFDVVRGKVGEAGVLCGSLGGRTLGHLADNTESGIYGKLTHKPADAGLYEIAQPYEVKLGAAQIRCDIGDGSQWYDVEVVKINVTDTSKKSMVIHVTDDRLLEKTGGIVQGMSGSPMVQNGKLVGAVTHVLVNDPSTGYALFARTMYDQATEYATVDPTSLPKSVAGVTVSISPDAA